jgi:endonuclease/exonuclease/phosphatase family metal-dependent hydrolase
VGLVRFACTHLDHTSHEQRAHSVSKLHQLMRSDGKLTLPLVLAGDFNARPAAPELRGLRSGGFVDAWEAAGTMSDAEAGGVDGFTIPTTPEPHARIDYVWMLNSEEGARAWRWHRARVVPTLASDHLPVVAELGRIKSGSASGAAARL